MFKVMETVFGIDEQWDVCMGIFTTEDAAQEHCDNDSSAGLWVQEETD
jgi:hypothetical protein